MPSADTSIARTMPKVVLHDHLDGGLRTATLFDLMQQRGIASPAATVAELDRWFDARAHAGSLTEYLRGFALTVAAMASVEALERVAYEAVVDAHAAGCVLAEFRIAPELFEPHGIPADVATEALVAGLARGRAASGLPSGLIVCAMRHHPPADILRSAKMALAWRDRGVLAFDLAGPEIGYPLSLHASVLALLNEAGMPLTLHAGEADEARHVLEAVQLGAARIGHGVKLAQAIGTRDQSMVDAVRDSGVHLEVCPSSNVHTGAAASIATHPIRALWEAGISLSFHPDNRLMSRVDMVSEAMSLMDEARFTPLDLREMSLQAARHSFLHDLDKARAIETIEAWTPPD